MKVKEASKTLFCTDSKKNKKVMMQLLKKILQSSGKMSSCIYINDKTEEILKRLGYIEEVKRVEDESSVNVYYNVMLQGELTGIALLKVKDNKYKIVPAGKFVKEVGDVLFRYCDSNSYVTATYKGKACKLEDVVDYIINGTDIIPGTCIHHKWFRFCALPNTIVRLTKERHRNLHSLIGNYARNQVAMIESLEEFELLISVVITKNEELGNRMFSSEF